MPHPADVSGIGKLEVSGSALAIAELYPSGRSPRAGRVLEAAEAGAGFGLTEGGLGSRGRSPAPAGA